MRTATFSVLLTAGALIASATPAYAADPWFAPYVETAIDNGIGPGPAPRGTATADFNSDGKPDIVTITDFTQGNLLVLTGDGDGTFTPAGEIAGTTQTQGIDAGDVNGDGKADVVAMTTNQVRIRYGNGAGGFTTGPTYSLTLGGQVEPRLMDLNGDGDLDIVAPTFTAIQTLTNNGSGTFTKGPTTQVPGTGAISAIDPARLNADGKADLFATDGFSGTTFALKGTGTGSFTVSGTLYASGLVPEDVTAIDLNGDSFDDVAVVGSFSFSLVTSLTNGNGAFTGPVGNFQFGGPGPTSAAAADLDGDGREDLVVSSLATPLPKLKVLNGNGTAAMAIQGEYAVGSLPQNPVIADYDLDGDLDIVTAGPGALSYLGNIS